MTILVTLLLLVGTGFLCVSCIGLLRLPDFYTRAHAVGKAETLASLLILLGLALYNGITLSSLKLLLIVLIVAITSPTATHALARAAIRSGLKVWRSPKEAQSHDVAG